MEICTFVESRYQPARIDAGDVSCQRALGIKRGDLAVAGAHEAVVNTVGVTISSRDRPIWSVTTAAAGICAGRAFRIKRGELALRTEHEAVGVVVGVVVGSRDFPTRVDAVSFSAVYRIGIIKRGNRALGGAQELRRLPLMS